MIKNLGTYKNSFLKKAISTIVCVAFFVLSLPLNTTCWAYNYNLRPLALTERDTTASLDWQRIKEKQQREVDWIKQYRLKIFETQQDILEGVRGGELVPVASGDAYRVLLDRIELVVASPEWQESTPDDVINAWGNLIKNPNVRNGITQRGYNPDLALPLCYLTRGAKSLLERISERWKTELANRGLPTTDERGNPLKLIITSVVRDNKYQQSLLKDPTKPAAEISSHTVGIAFDISRGWLEENLPANAQVLRVVLQEFEARGEINLLDEQETGAWHVALNPGYMAVAAGFEINFSQDVENEVREVLVGGLTAERLAGMHIDVSGVKGIEISKIAVTEKAVSNKVPYRMTVLLKDGAKRHIIIRTIGFRIPENIKAYDPLLQPQRLRYFTDEELATMAKIEASNFRGFIPEPYGYIFIPAETEGAFPKWVLFDEFIEGGETLMELQERLPQEQFKGLVKKTLRVYFDAIGEFEYWQNVDVSLDDVMFVEENGEFRGPYFIDCGRIIDPGEGNPITLYANAAHKFLEVFRNFCMALPNIGIPAASLSLEEFFEVISASRFGRMTVAERQEVGELWGLEKLKNGLEVLLSRMSPRTPDAILTEALLMGISGLIERGTQPRLDEEIDATRELALINSQI